MAIFFTMTHHFCYFFTFFYISPPIFAPHMTGSTVGIRGYADFHCPHPTFLYYYDDKRGLFLICNGSAQIVRKLVITGSTMGIRGYADFHFPHPNSLYCYGDEERTCQSVIVVPRPLESWSPMFRSQIGIELGSSSHVSYLKMLSFLALGFIDWRGLTSRFQT